MFLSTEGRNRILREVVTVVALLLCAVTLLLLQYQVCVYWLPENDHFSSARWEDADRIRFCQSRLVDWRTGKAWLDPIQKRAEVIAIFPSPTLRVELQATDEDFAYPRGYRATYKDAGSDRVLQSFELSIEGSLQPIGPERLWTANYFLLLPEQIARVDFQPSGPRVSKITLPPPPPGSDVNHFEFRWLDPTRLVRAFQVSQPASTAPNSIGNLPWRLELFQIEGATACNIGIWQCASRENVHVDGDQVTSLTVDGAQLEVRDRNGLLLRREPVPWTQDWKPEDANRYSVRVSGQGFILVTDTTTDHRTYFDATTLHSLPAPDGNSWIRDYDRKTGRIVFANSKEIVVSWREGDRPALAAEFAPAFNGVEVATKGSLIVAADHEDALRFLVIDTDQQTSQHFDLRMRRVWAIAATGLVMCLAFAIWTWSSLRWRCPVWLDVLVIGAALVGLEEFSATLLGCNIGDLANSQWHAVSFAWVSVSSLWLVHGERSFVFRLAIHLFVISFILMTTVVLGVWDGFLIFYAEFLIIAAVVPIVYSFLGIAVVRGLHSSDRIAPSNALKITDLLFLMVAFSLFLVSMQRVNDFFGFFWVLEESMEFDWIEWIIFIAIAAVCLGFSIAILAPYRTRAAWLFGLIFIVLFVSLCSAIAFPTLWDPFDQSPLIAIGALALGHVLSMSLLRWHGWRFRWRWGARSVSNSGMTG